MKRNHSKIILILMAVSGLIGGQVLMNRTGVDKSLRVAFPSTQAVEEYEPTNISLGHEYILLENLFSPLVEIDNKGNPTAGVAEKIEWDGEWLKLTIRTNLKTKSGKSITAEDAEFSLKRLLVLSGNTHGNFKDIVCPNEKITSVDSYCSGIKREGNVLFLNGHDKKTFLTPMLGAIDFAIIPKSSVDPVTLKIKDYTETSGAYYVISDDKKGHIELKLNPNHYFANSQIPQVIHLVPSSEKSSLEMLAKNEVDHITTVDKIKSAEMLKFAADNDGYNVHATYKIRSTVLVFTEKGQKELSLDQRRYIGEKIKAAMLKNYEGALSYSESDQFFPTASEVSLTPKQKAEIDHIRSSVNPSDIKKFKLGLIKRGNLEEWSKNINELLPMADCYIETNVPEFKKDLKSEDMPQAFIASSDSSFAEDIGLLSYTLNTGILGLTKAERQQWLKHYMSVDDKAQRLNLVNQLQFNALKNSVLVPLVASPYTAIVRKPWKPELSPLFANNQLWRIKL
jgi:MarR-like DNA-binding transcriptional regulator SgrR of sgrS sRNA